VTRRTAVRTAFGVLCVGTLTVATIDQWPRVSDAVGSVSIARLALALAGMIGGTYVSMLAWRAVLDDLGSPLRHRDAAGIFFVGQLGKYLPGSVWPVVAQMELGRERAVPRKRSAAAALLVIAVALTAGGIVAAATLPFTAGGDIHPYRYVFLLPAAGLVLLWPPVFNRIATRVFRAERGLTTRGIATALGWAVAQWLAYGAAIHALTGGDTGRLALNTGAYALAWCAGFLFLVAPAGAGVREGALALLLAPAIGSGRALGYALVARLLATVADLLLGVAAYLGTVVTRGTRDQDVPSTRRDT
jgi:glycosyltransferase 2 family protein